MAGDFVVPHVPVRLNHGALQLCETRVGKEHCRRFSTEVNWNFPPVACAGSAVGARAVLLLYNTGRGSEGGMAGECERILTLMVSVYWSGQKQRSAIHKRDGQRACRTSSVSCAPGHCSEIRLMSFAYISHKHFDQLLQSDTGKVEGSSSPSPNVKLDQTPCRSSCQRHVLTRLHEQSTLLLSREPSQVSRTGLLSRTFTQVLHRLRPSGLSSQSVRVSKASFIQLASDVCFGLRLTVVSAPPCRTEADAWSSATVETEGSVSWLPPSSSAQALSSAPDNLTQTVSWCWWIILMLPEVFYFYFKH